MVRKSEGKTTWDLITTLACSLQVIHEIFYLPSPSRYIQLLLEGTALNYLCKGYMFIYQEPAMNGLWNGEGWLVAINIFRSLNHKVSRIPDVLHVTRGLLYGFINYPACITCKFHGSLMHICSRR